MTEAQKQNVRRWIAALRSGEYKQGESFLCSEGRYCCLGVACEVYQQQGPGGLTVESKLRLVDVNPKIELHVTYFNGEAATLPLEVMNWLGLRAVNGLFSYDMTQTSLTQLNDGTGGGDTVDAPPQLPPVKMNFEQIADFVEKCLEDTNTQLFVRNAVDSYDS